MSQASTLELLRELSLLQADETAFVRLFGDAVRELNYDPWLTTVSRISIIRDQAEYAAPEGCVAILGAVYDDHWLDILSEADAASLGSSWRDDRGTPGALIFDGTSAKTFRLYPSPEESTPTIPLFPPQPTDPLAAGYVRSALYLFHTSYLGTTPTWLDLHLAFVVAAKEFARESNHQDLDFSSLLAELAKLTLRLVR